MMGSLEVPYQLTSRRIQGQHRVGITLVQFSPVTTVNIRGTDTRWYVDDVQLCIIGQRCPSIWRVMYKFLTRRRNQIWIFSTCVKYPKQFTGIDIITTDHTRWFFS